MDVATLSWNQSRLMTVELGLHGSSMILTPNTGPESELRLLVWQNCQRYNRPACKCRYVNKLLLARLDAC